MAGVVHILVLVLSFVIPPFQGLVATMSQNIVVIYAHYVIYAHFFQEKSAGTANEMQPRIDTNLGFGAGGIKKAPRRNAGLQNQETVKPATKGLTYTVRPSPAGF
jgi:hypothetical protein